MNTSKPSKKDFKIDVVIMPGGCPGKTYPQIPRYIDTSVIDLPLYYIISREDYKIVMKDKKLLDNMTNFMYYYSSFFARITNDIRILTYIETNRPSSYDLPMFPGTVTVYKRPHVCTRNKVEEVKDQIKEFDLNKHIVYLVKEYFKPGLDIFAIVLRVIKETGLGNFMIDYPYDSCKNCYCSICWLCEECVNGCTKEERETAAIKRSLERLSVDSVFSCDINTEYVSDSDSECGIDPNEDVSDSDSECVIGCDNDPNDNN